MVELVGMTWNHPRGVAPLVAATAAFREAHPDVTISWDARSLQEFEETSVAALADRYDLLMIDHPFVGVAAEAQALVPLEEVLAPEFLDDQALNSVGPSHRSYLWEGHQWALATDAASQVSAYRPDLLQAISTPVPRTWEEVFELAGRPGQSVAMPLNPTHLLSSFMSLCSNFSSDGEDSGTEGPQWLSDAGIDEQLAVAAIEHLYRLTELVHPLSLGADPIQVLDTMAGTNEVLYAPLCFGYSNYSRTGFAKEVVRFADIPSTSSRPVGAVLGGVGMAISRRCEALDVATSFLTFVNGPDNQRGLYFSSGGQPGYRAAWTDAEVNSVAHGFFKDTLETLDLAMLRPRWPGYPALQRRSGQMMHDLFRRRTPSVEIAKELNSLWVASSERSRSSVNGGK